MWFKNKKSIKIKEISNVKYNNFLKSVLEKKLIKNLSVSNYS